MMEAIQLYPVLISKIPRKMTVDQVHSNAFSGVKMEHKASFLYLSELNQSINSNQRYMMLFKSLSAQLAVTHSINSNSRKNNAWNVMASIPNVPYLPLEFHQSRWKELSTIKKYSYKDDDDTESIYDFKNCLAMEIMKRMPQRWTVLPIAPDTWHLVRFPEVQFKHNVNDRNLIRFAITMSDTFDGVVLDPNDESRVSIKHCYRGHLFGLVWNSDWDCQHPFGLKADFVHKQKVLFGKKATFKISLSHSTIQNHELKSIFHLKPNPFSFATSVQIMAKRNSFKKAVPNNDIVKKKSVVPRPERRQIPIMRSWQPNQGIIYIFWYILRPINF